MIYSPITDVIDGVRHYLADNGDIFSYMMGDEMVPKEPFLEWSGPLYISDSGLTSSYGGLTTYKMVVDAKQREAAIYVDNLNPNPLPIRTVRRIVEAWENKPTFRRVSRGTKPTLIFGDLTDAQIMELSLIL